MTPVSALIRIGKDVERHWRVLDVGCRDGAQYTEWFVSKGCNVTGIDIKNYSDDCSKKGFQFILTSLEDYRPDSRCDVVLAMNVLPFLKCSWDERMAHLTRLMLPGALLLLTVFTPDNGFKGDADVTTIGADELRDLLQRHHLKVRYKCHEQYEGPTYEGTVKAWSVIGVVAELAA
jgi:SAM-dependent methyltransferase